MSMERTPGLRLAEGVARLLARLPLSVHYRFARFLAWLLGSVLRYRRSTVLINLGRSFPEKDYKEIELIMRAFYRHLADMVAEAVWFGGCRGEKGCERLRRQHLVEIEGLEEINPLWDRRPGLLLLNSHAGNWELMGGIFEYNYQQPPHYTLAQTVVLYLRQSSAFWDRFLADNRLAPVAHKGFEGYVENRSILRYAISHKNEKRLYIFNTDQYPYGSSAFCNVGLFLNQSTVSMTGGASLAAKFGLGVAYIRWQCPSRGHYKMTLVPLFEDASQHTPEEIMIRYHALLQEDIQAEPWNYLWTHKRWKNWNESLG